MCGRIDIGSLHPAPRQGDGTCTRGGTGGAVLVHNLDRLTIRAGQGNINVTDIGMLDLNTDIENIVGTGNDGCRGEGIESHRRLVGATPAAVHTVGEEYSVRHVQDGQLLAVNRIQMHNAIIEVAEGNVHFRAGADRRGVGETCHRRMRGAHTEGHRHRGHTAAHIGGVDQHIVATARHKVIVDHIAPQRINLLGTHIPDEMGGSVGLGIAEVVVRIFAAYGQTYCIVRTDIDIVVAVSIKHRHV